MKLWATLIVVVVALACFYGGYRAGYGAASAVRPAPTITAPQNVTNPQVVVSSGVRKGIDKGNCRRDF